MSFTSHVFVTTALLKIPLILKRKERIRNSCAASTHSLTRRRLHRGISRVYYIVGAPQTFQDIRSAQIRTLSSLLPALLASHFFVPTRSNQYKSHSSTPKTRLLSMWRRARTSPHRWHMPLSCSASVPLSGASSGVDVQRPKR